MRLGRMLVLVAIFFGASCAAVDWSAWADETAPAVESADPALINHPTTGWELTKSFVGYIEPGTDVVVPFNASQDGPIQGFSGALYTFEANGFKLASVRAGYGLTDPVSYGTLALDLNGLAHLLPASVRGLSPGVVNAALAFGSKFVRIGPSVGYDWDDQRPVFGVSVGAALTTSF